MRERNDSNSQHWSDLIFLSFVLWSLFASLSGAVQGDAVRLWRFAGRTCAPYCNTPFLSWKSFEIRRDTTSMPVKPCSMFDNREMRCSRPAIGVKVTGQRYLVTPSAGSSGVALSMQGRAEPHLGEAYSYALSHSLLPSLLAPSHALQQPTIADLHLDITQPHHRPSTLLTPLPTDCITKQPPYQSCLRIKAPKATGQLA